MGRDELNELARALRERRAQILEDLLASETELREIAEQNPSEVEELAEEAREALLLERLDDRRRQEIAELDHALQRIADGSHGTCEQCGQAIGAARLAAVPATRFCLVCAGAEPASRDRDARAPAARSPRATPRG
jgi:RNA polymerase-binding protein DksA